MSCDCAAKLAEAEARAERYAEILRRFAGRSSRTGSGDTLCYAHACKSTSCPEDCYVALSRAALLPPPEPAHVCLGCGTEGEPHPILHGCDRYGEPKPPEPAAEGGSNG